MQAGRSEWDRETLADMICRPIKTYNGLGVAAPGVTKAHHAIVYTARHTPQPTPAELPRRLPNGNVEPGMQPHPIRIVPTNSEFALDPMSRLDFSDVYSFNDNVSNIRLVGAVHRDWMSTLNIEYQTVWATILRHPGRDSQSSATGPATASNSASEGLQRQPEYVQAMVDRLVRQGYTREQAIEALRRSMAARQGGDGSTGNRREDDEDDDDDDVESDE